MTVYQQRLDTLSQAPRTWAVTGVAGFIGSNLLQQLLITGQRVVGLDNFVTGHRRNLVDVERTVGPVAWGRFQLMEGDIRDPDVCQRALAGVDAVLHQAALGSVPLSLERPDQTHAVNVTGFVNILQAARAARVSRVVYASSCAVYGDDAESPKLEERLGRSLSPYATSKHLNELYADVFARCYGLTSVGLRYFNVYGRRQDPNGAYAAVIPKWIDALLRGESVQIHGDGQTSRDFVQVQDVVQANLLAATADLQPETAAVCNVGTGEETSLNELFAAIRDCVNQLDPDRLTPKPSYGEFRVGDIRYSRADLGRAQRVLGYVPQFNLNRGLREAFEWYGKFTREAEVQTA
jgi:UDP-N-acetylglucosamine/UDP-N-acetylgalactosamine 4-epimerase